MVTDYYSKQNQFMKPSYLSVLLLAITLSACASNSTIKPLEKTLVHIVLIWLKDAGNQEHIQQVAEVTKQLEAIPEIQELRMGTSVPSNRKIVDDSFDIGIYMIFKSEESMEIYLRHPKHQEAVRKIIKPLTRKIIVYDISN